MGPGPDLHCQAWELVLHLTRNVLVTPRTLTPPCTHGNMGPSHQPGHPVASGVYHGVRPLMTSASSNLHSALLSIWTLAGREETSRWELPCFLHVLRSKCAVSSAIDAYRSFKKQRWESKSNGVSLYWFSGGLWCSLTQATQREESYIQHWAFFFFWTNNGVGWLHLNSL